jgi:hypothetical protein
MTLTLTTPSKITTILNNNIPAGTKFTGNIRGYKSIFHKIVSMVSDRDDLHLIVSLTEHTSRGRNVYDYPDVEVQDYQVLDLKITQ